MISFRTLCGAMNLCGAMAALAIAGAATADEGHAEARKLREAGAILPLEAIVEKARTARSGQIIETELERDDGRYVYEVEILDDAGTVWELKLDASSGDLIEITQDD